MELSSEGKGSRLTVEVTGGEFIEYPSLNLLVTVSDEGFCEARSYAWMTLDLLHKPPALNGRAVIEQIPAFHSAMERSD